MRSVIARDHCTVQTTVLYCTVLYCTVLYCTVLYCTDHCTVQTTVLLVSSNPIIYMQRCVVSIMSCSLPTTAQSGLKASRASIPLTNLMCKNRFYSLSWRIVLCIRVKCSVGGWWRFVAVVRLLPETAVLLYVTRDLCVAAGLLNVGQHTIHDFWSWIDLFSWSYCARCVSAFCFC